MKTTIKLLSILVLIALGTGCSKVAETDVPVAEPSAGRLVVHADVAETRTTIAKDGDTYKMSWDGDESAMLVLRRYDTWECYLYPSNAATLTEGSMSFSFGPLDTGSGTTAYDILYPQSSCLDKNVRDVYVKLPTTQTPKATTVDPAASLLYGRSTGPEEYGAYATPPASLDVTFKHAAAYAKMNLSGIPAGETISSIAVTAEDCNIAGEIIYHAHSGSIDYTRTSESTITLDGSNLTPGAAGVDVWFACKPFTLPEGKTLTIVTTTSGGTHTSVLTAASAIAFEAGKVTTFPAYSDTYTVTFDSQGGSDIAPVAVHRGRPVVPPADPAKAGALAEGLYLGDIEDAEAGALFAGWYTDPGCTTAYDFNTPVTSNLTLYAKWDTREPIDLSEYPENTDAWNAGNHYPYRGIAYVNAQALGEVTNYTIIMNSNCTVWGGGITMTNPNAVVRLIGKGAERAITRNNCSTFVTIEAGKLILGKNLLIRYTDNLEATWSTNPLIQTNGANAVLVIDEGCRLDGSVARHQLLKASGAGSKIIMEGGSISGNSNSVASSDFINLADGTCFIMNGGTISNNTLKARMLTPKSGAASALNGGTISGNTFGDYLITVMNGNAEFSMTGGSITNNTGSPANSGATVGCNWGIFTMSGGEISGNTVTTSSLTESVSGGVLYGGSYSGGDHRFEKTGGSITGNTAARSASGTVTGFRGQQVVYAGKSKKIDAGIDAATSVSSGDLGAPWVDATPE